MNRAVKIVKICKSSCHCELGAGVRSQYLEQGAIWRLLYSLAHSIQATVCRRRLEWMGERRLITYDSTVLLLLRMVMMVDLETVNYSNEHRQLVPEKTTADAVHYNEMFNWIETIFNLPSKALCKMTIITIIATVIMRQGKDLMAFPPLPTMVVHFHFTFFLFGSNHGDGEYRWQALNEHLSVTIEHHYRFAIKGITPLPLGRITFNQFGHHQLSSHFFCFLLLLHATQYWSPFFLIFWN